jgi:glucose/mannose-6-phosphate isomerase
MMKTLIADFAAHLKEAIEVGENKTFQSPQNEIKQVLICGLGGSGIGGTIISQLLSQQCKVPIVVNKDYFIPEFVNENTLVICCSYSGNTEETLSMYEKAKEKGAEIAIIASGGAFIENANENKHNYIQIRDGFPPRAAFGLSFPQLFFVFHNYGLIAADFKAQLKAAISLIENKEEAIREEAKKLADILHQKIPVIYSVSSLEGVAVRFRQQINENAKMLCWHHAIPEMNHNELVGWRSENQELAVVYFRSENDYYRNKARIEQNKHIISKYTSHIVEVLAQGDSALERTLYLIHLGDWASEYLAQLKDIDSVEVDVISGLKSMLSDLD